VASWTLYGPGAPDTVRWHTGQSDAPDHSTLGFFAPLYLNPNFNLLLVCVGHSTTKINTGKRLTLFPFQSTSNVAGYTRTSGRLLAGAPS
jgi:hypothetical protein